MQVAAAHGHVEMCNLLLACRADVNARKDFRCSSLHLAAHGGHTVRAREMREGGRERATERDRERERHRTREMARGEKQVEEMRTEYGGRGGGRGEKLGDEGEMGDDE
eukprot:758273-Hanusia_phi.AAC.2